MKKFIKSLFFIILMIPALTSASLLVGIGKSDITPPLGTPSAGYSERKGEGMQGVHDPLLAIALFLDNGEKQLVLCSVDHLGFTYEMVQEIIEQVHREPKLEHLEIYIGSSHTHSGGGAFLNMPLIGEILAGPYSKETTQFYIQKTVEAILQASRNLIPAKIGIGYGKGENLSKYRALWPKEGSRVSDIAVIKVTNLDKTPLAVLFNFAVHPTVLKSHNRLFSSDFVGFARDHLQALLGKDVQPLYFNGAQGDIIPIIFNEKDQYQSCAFLGKSLGELVKEIFDEIEVSDALSIQTESKAYTFLPEATPFGLKLPINSYESALSVIVLNKQHAFITIPGELSSLYDQRLKASGKELGYCHVSIFGLTNDAHGYIIHPDSWRHKTLESRLSFGGEHYGELTELRALDLLKNNAP